MNNYEVQLQLLYEWKVNSFSWNLHCKVGHSMNFIKGGGNPVNSNYREAALLSSLPREWIVHIFAMKSLFVKLVSWKLSGRRPLRNKLSILKQKRTVSKKVHWQSKYKALFGINWWVRVIPQTRLWSGDKFLFKIHRNWSSGSLEQANREQS